MFSFHKPKVYRSTAGCCICKAKSSSSRFTDSKKYEDDFLQCFKLSEKRYGEVCNACVLLVKRWKKLPQGNSRNWHHVVDARAGPGTKSMSKFKVRKDSSRNKEKRKARDDDYDEPCKKKREQSPGSDEHLVGDEGSEESPEGSRSPTPYEEDRVGDINKRLSQPSVSSFVDLSIWKREKICCGTVFVGPYGALIVDPRFVKPCRTWQLCSLKNQSSTAVPLRSAPGSRRSAVAPLLKAQAPATGATATTAVQAKYSDSSSDSGYDESSNPPRTLIPAN